MKKRNPVLIGIIVQCVLIMSNCTSEIKCEPVVVVSEIDYFTSGTGPGFGDIWQTFADTYSGADLSKSLRNELIEIMQEKAIGLGEDENTLYNCIKVTYADWDARPERIPCYAEKCYYDTEPIWAIAFNRANSFEEESLGHIDIFYVSVTDYEIVHYDGCL